MYDPKAHDGKGSISLLIASAGDWTRNLLQRLADDRPPTRIWVRRTKPLGFMYSVNAYRRPVVLATGAGIAPMLPYIMSGSAPIFVVWIAHDPAVTFGDLSALVRGHPHVLIHDTERFGRPDAARLALDAANSFGADAVFCVSNPAVTRGVVTACLAAGVPAFGATWDS